MHFETPSSSNRSLKTRTDISSSVPTDPGNSLS